MATSNEKSRVATSKEKTNMDSYKMQTKIKAKFVV